MRILVIGVRGQVAQAMAERASSHGVTVQLVGRPELDLLQPDSIEAVVRNSEADAIVNAAAYTAVDQAEAEPDLAMAVNGTAAGVIAATAARLRIPVVHLSTDYVFDGTLDRSYREVDQVQPLGVYGRSKLAGERAVAAATPNHVILRTSWVYSPTGKNFVKTMLRLATDRDEVSVVADQYGAPTSALDIADGAIAICRNLVERRDKAGLRGLFHMTGAGSTSWAEFASTIFDLSCRFEGPSARVRPITTAEYPTPARRPANSRLDCTKLAATYGVTLPPWQRSLERCVRRLVRPAYVDEIQ
ncbi:dTDP-4-dehydrorhamnose reductase [Microvirga pakistanensis]|uniref:dTDP-4-dehydrorhamnose reductase n=1 Tax=Microvirga pakistanensis TaxID=1682650 RepID=UPI00106D5B4F|nr:dTDP-4-dehydrorhamnose reductase [Microvirga pakistanensis]